MKKERQLNKKKSDRIAVSCMALCMLVSMCACGSKNSVTLSEDIKATSDTTAYGSAKSDSIAFAPADTTKEAVGKSDMSLEGSEVFESGEKRIEDDRCIEEYPIEDELTYIEAVAGTLTAGEWSDNNNWDFFQRLLQGNQDFSMYQTNWKLTPKHRIKVHVTSSNQEAVVGAKVSFVDQQNQLIYQAVTDHNGNAYVFYGLFSQQQDGIGKIEVATAQANETVDITSEMTDVDIMLSTYEKPTKKLDVMFLCDTTGSMGDELIFLQKEVENVIETVKQTNANLPTRVSVGFYRDHGDEYVVSNYPFDTNLDAVSNILRQQNAEGGGDYEEAMEEALYDAVYNLEWSDDSTKICFIILDAPPHQNSEVCDTLHKIIMEAAKNGIRIIPIAGSGVDKNTEFLLRTLAMTTGGTYTFLTDDSGVGGSHIEPTVGDYRIEKLNDMMIRLINEYLAY